MQQTDKHLSAVIEAGRKIKERAKQDIKFAPPIIVREGTGIIYPHTINAIQGKSGTHKSRLTEYLCACILSNDHEKDFVGFRLLPNTGPSFDLLYCDTERNNKDQFPAAIQRIKKLAGYDITADVPGLDCISLIQIPRNKRFDALAKYLDHIRPDITRHLVVVLDVVTDCVSDFNNVTESMKLIDLMNAAIDAHPITFICVIHENPGHSHKARGHLGTEVLNKSSAQIQIGFVKDQQRETDAICVKYLKLRTVKKPPPFYLTYCADEKGLVQLNEDEAHAMNGQPKEKADIQQVCNSLAIRLTKPMPRKELLNLLKIDFDCHPNTIDKRMKTILDGQHPIITNNGTTCILATEKDGPKLLYSLKPVVKDEPQ